MQIFLERTYNLAELPAVADEVLKAAGTHQVLCLKGELGAGKTTLVKAMLQAMGYAGSSGSPSFGLIHVYETPQGLVHHADLYRLKGPDELETLGLEEMLYGGHRCWIEWAEVAETLLPDDALQVELKIVGPEARLLRLYPIFE
jgi:tRNA threonylcarbamoyladenosine biosynthesis protein TsaE